MPPGDRGDRKVSSYRMTSYLTLVSPELRGEPPDSPRKPDPFGKGVVVATDRPGQTKKRRKKISTPRDVFDVAASRVKESTAQVREVAAYPFKLAGWYMDQIVDSLEQVSYLMKQAFEQGVAKNWEKLTQASPDVEEPESPLEMGPKVSFMDLQALNIQFTDNYDQPLYPFEKNAKQPYQMSPLIIDPAATERALMAIRECAERAASIPPASDGRYRGIPLSDVMSQSGEIDLQGFLAYVKAYPGNYVGRLLKISETFATWVVYGAPDP